MVHGCLASNKSSKDSALVDTTLFGHDTYIVRIIIGNDPCQLAKSQLHFCYLGSRGLEAVYAWKKDNAGLQ